jgi:amino acid adenylation domain-containing protein
MGRHETITSLFHEQVKLHPFDTAVDIEDGQSVTYADLDKQASQLSLALPSDAIVAICLERSLGLLVSVLGVLKAGSAYVVLDSAVPVERNAFILRDAGAAVLITTETRAAVFSPSTIANSTTIHMLSDLLRPAPLSPPRSPTAEPIGPDSKAYIIYTSGSSGSPKGVVHTHGAAAYGIQHFSLSDRRRWLFFFNPIFSAAQRTMLATLCKGGTLCLAASNDRLTTALPDVLTRLYIDSVGLTPSILASLLETEAPNTEVLPACLQSITCFGEPLSRAVAEKFFAVANGARIELRVSYGLSEVAQLNFGRALTGKEDDPSVMGRPSDTTQAIVLRPGTVAECENGDAGELCLFGPQISNGYLNRDAEMERSFIQGPWGRMLRTGDAARAVAGPGGTPMFEILGRLDDQIKINGQRLDPSEVVAVISRNPGVSAAYVVAAEVKGTKSLVAAVVLRKGRDDSSEGWAETVSSLRRTVQHALPSYMNPPYWLRLNELPLNPNGKVDSKAIRARVQASSSQELLARSNQVEAVHQPDAELDRVDKIIQQVWGKFVDMEPSLISRSDSFLDLGASSIQGIQMLSELRKSGVHLTLEAILSRESLSDLAAKAIDSGNAGHSAEDSHDGNVEPFSLLRDTELSEQLKRTSGVQDAFPTTEFQENVIELTLNGRTSYTYQRVWDIKGLDKIRLGLALHLFFLKSPTLRTTFVASKAGTGFLQLVKSDMELSLVTTTASVDDYLAEDMASGFRLGEPFFRAAVVQDSILVMTMHHALFDFWSHMYLYEDVAAYYRGLWPKPRPGLRAFVGHVLQSIDQDESEKYWKRQFEGAPKTNLNFAPASSTPTPYRRALSIDLTPIASLHRVIPAVIIYVAWSLLLTQHLNSTDVLFFTPLSGRDTPIVDIDRVDGPTIAIVPLRMSFKFDMSLRQCTAVAHNVVMGALKFGQLGLRPVLKAAGQASGSFTVVNILPVGGQVNEPWRDVFKVHGEKQVLETNYTTLSLEGTQATLKTSMESVRAGFVMDHLEKILQLMLHEPDRPLNTVNLTTGPELQMLHQIQVTETTELVAMRVMDPHNDPGNLGHMLPPARPLIVKRDGSELVPYGAIGELCVGRPQLATGGLNRPEQTATAFVGSDLIVDKRIMYRRTGDLARWLPNGEIEYVDRKDNQVKTNGK